MRSLRYIVIVVMVLAAIAFQCVWPPALKACQSDLDNSALIQGVTHIQLFLCDSLLFEMNWLAETRPKDMKALWKDLEGLFYIPDARNEFKSPRHTRLDGGDCEDLAAYALVRLAQMEIGARYGLLFLMQTPAQGHVVTVFMDQDFNTMVIDPSILASVNSGLSPRFKGLRPIWGGIDDYLLWMKRNTTMRFTFYQVWWFDESPANQPLPQCINQERQVSVSHE